MSLWRPSNDGPQPLGAPFYPRYTYSVFGDEQQIFGYKDLEIQLKFRSNDMRPFFQLKYKSRFEAIGETEPTDIKEELQQHLPPVAFGTEADWVESAKQPSLVTSWTPPGELYTTITESNATYEVWKGTLADPAIMQLIKRMQILVLLFIEGGSNIIDPDSDEADDRWTVWFLYKKERSEYRFVGYSTVYRFYFFDKKAITTRTPSDPYEIPEGNFDLAQHDSRVRLSQFLILPPYQNDGNGARLYQTIFNHYYTHPQTRQFTVEDPNEAFDDLRDVCDLEFLQTLPEFTSLAFKSGVTVPREGQLPELIDRKAIEAAREKSKIVPRQFMRCLEMYLMSRLPESVRPSLDLEDTQSQKRVVKPAERQQYHLWELFIKSRLLIHNRDALAEMDLPERLETLDRTFEGVKTGHANIWHKFERFHSRGKTGGTKRRSDDDEEVDSNPSKKARVEEADEDE